MAYDSENKKLYIASDSGITLKEVFTCLNETRLDVRRKIDLGMMCTSPKIVIWAKNKPFVKVNKTTAFEKATDAERYDANYGLYIPKASYINSVKGFYDGNMNSWGHAAPRGIAATYTEPFRLDDFDGYWHKAACPFTRLALPQASDNIWPTSGFKIAIPISSGGSVTEAIGMTEIKAIQNYYFTIQIRHTNPQGTGIFIRTLSADNTVAQGTGGYIEFSTFQLPEGEWEIIPFLSPVKFTMDNDGNEIPATYNYISIPKCYVGKMTISSIEYGLVYFDGYKNPYVSGATTRRFSFNFAVKNYTANSHTFDDVIVRVRFPEKKFDDTLVTGESQPTIESFTVGAGETVDYAAATSEGSLKLKWVTVSISQALYDNFTGVIVYIQLGSGQPVYQMYLRSSSTDTPEYDDNTDYEPITPNV